MADNICSSLSSSDSSSSSSSISSSAISDLVNVHNQFSPPSALVNDIVHETITFEHTEDFIKSLQIPLDVLDDLASRFLLNMPQEEKYDPIRICFQMENAFWHYLDFCCECNSKLPKFKFKKFAQIMFTYVPRLRQFLDIFDDIIHNWIQYKFSIPCSGAIMLDETMEYILLVQGFGSKTWGFPKGKVNHDESLMNCAVREVFEETGYNCMGNIYESQYLERKIFESRLRLYLIKNVAFNFDFKPQARNEIRSIKWFALKDFPQHDQRKTFMAAQGNGNVLMPQNASKFVSVMPFIFAIRKWIDNEKRKQKAAKKRERKHLARQMRKHKQQQNSDIIQDDAIVSMEEQPIPSNIIAGSSSTSPSTVAEDDDTMSNNIERIIELVSDNEQQLAPLPTVSGAINQSTGVQVDLKDILGFKEMYNIQNDQRQLMTREELDDDRKGSQPQHSIMNNHFQSAIWNKLIPGDNHRHQNPALTSNHHLNMPSPTLPPTQVRTLEDIERSMIINDNKTSDQNSLSGSNQQIQYSTLDLLASKGGDCKKKLNLLFGLTQSTTESNVQSSSIHNSFIQSPHQNKNSTGPSMISTTESPSPLKPQTPKMAPIGTRRNGAQRQSTNHTKSTVTMFNQQESSLNDKVAETSNNKRDNQHCDHSSNHNEQRSGQIVISPSLNDDDDGLFIKTTTKCRQEQPKQSVQLLNGLFEKFNMAMETKNQVSTTLLSPSNKLTDIEKIDSRQNKFNGLRPETKAMVQPKIELLLQRLLAINNSA